MVSLVALLFVALGTGQVFFHGITKYVSDVLTTYPNSWMELSTAISFLIISIPIYFYLAYYLNKSLKNGELDKDAAIRRWLVYFILFVSSVVAVVWLIVTINNYLDGELALRFMLKAATAIIISGIIFSYYFYDIRRDKIKDKDVVVRTFFIGTLIITVGALVFSFFFVETPKEARARKHDSIILDHFTQLDSAVNTFYTKTDRLPNSLEEALTESPYLNLATFKDPNSGKGYEYKKIDASTYELCAEFMTDNRNPENQRTYAYADRWPHESGYRCLKQKALDFNNADQGGLKPIR